MLYAAQKTNDSNSIVAMAIRGIEALLFLAREVRTEQVYHSQSWTLCDGCWG